MLVRITKEYNNRSPKNGIIEVDKLEFNSLDDAALWVTKVNANNSIDFNIIDYEAASIHVGKSGPEVISNPTGGALGKIH